MVEQHISRMEVLMWVSDVMMLLSRSTRF